MRYLFLSVLLVVGCNHTKQTQQPDRRSTNDYPRSTTIKPDLRPECPITVEIDPETDIMTEWDNSKAVAYFTLRSTCTFELLGTQQILYYHGAGELASNLGGSFMVYNTASNGLLHRGDLVLGGKGPSTTEAFGQLWEQFLLVAETPGTTVEPGVHRITVWPQDTTGEVKPGPSGNFSAGDKVFLTFTGIFYRFPDDSLNLNDGGYSIRVSEVNLTGSVLTVPAN